jgi:hypothetical protein
MHVKTHPILGALSFTHMTDSDRENRAYESWRWTGNR